MYDTDGTRTKANQIGGSIIEERYCLWSWKLIYRVEKAQRLYPSEWTELRVSGDKVLTQESDNKENFH